MHLSLIQKRAPGLLHIVAACIRFLGDITPHVLGVSQPHEEGFSTSHVEL